MTTLGEGCGVAFFDEFLVQVGSLGNVEMGVFKIGIVQDDDNSVCVSSWVSEKSESESECGGGWLGSDRVVCELERLSEEIFTIERLVF